MPEAARISHAGCVRNLRGEKTWGFSRGPPGVRSDLTLHQASAYFVASAGCNVNSLLAGIAVQTKIEASPAIRYSANFTAGNRIRNPSSNVESRIASSIR